MNAASRRARSAAAGERSKFIARMIVCRPVKDHASPVRPAEQLDWARLADYLRLTLPALDLPAVDCTGPMEVAQFPGGHSNLTYLVRLGAAEFVLRRPPFGPVPRRAHDMAREYAWLAAVYPVFPLAPRPYLLCDDASVIGSRFYVMERRHGAVLRQSEPPAIADHPDVRPRVSAAVVDSPPDLHAVSTPPTRLSGLCN